MEGEDALEKEYLRVPPKDASLQFVFKVYVLFATTHI
jgi:hypothetical protein